MPGVTVGDRVVMPMTKYLGKRRANLGISPKGLDLQELSLALPAHFAP
jgi:hypothetical protein